MPGKAQIAAIHVSRAHFQQMEPLKTARAVTELGLEGDRYAAKAGANRSKRQVLLMDQETLEELGLSPGTVRENITTKGLNIYSLAPGRQLKIGAQVVLEITEPCHPCQRMDQVRPGLREELQGRRGMLARVLQGGPISVGDPLALLEPAPSSLGGSL